MSLSRELSDTEMEVISVSIPANISEPEMEALNHKVEKLMMSGYQLRAQSERVQLNQFGSSDFDPASSVAFHFGD